MRKVIGAVAVAAMVAGFAGFGGASEPSSARPTLASVAMTRAGLAGCDRFQVTQENRFLKRIGVICEDGRAHWISHDGALTVDGRAI